MYNSELDILLHQRMIFFWNLIFDRLPSLVRREGLTGFYCEGFLWREACGGWDKKLRMSVCSAADWTCQPVVCGPWPLFSGEQGLRNLIMGSFHDATAVGIWQFSFFKLKEWIVFILDLACLKHLVPWVLFGLETWFEYSVNFRRGKKTMKPCHFLVQCLKYTSCVFITVETSW